MTCSKRTRSRFPSGLRETDGSLVPDSQLIVLDVTFERSLSTLLAL